MKVDPQRLDFKCVTLAMLIGYAFRIPPGRVTGPGWMMGPGSPRFDVAATIPQGMSKDQIPEMLQNLLADRFTLTVHRSTAMLPVYALRLARGGPKIKGVAPQGSDKDSSGISPEASPDAFYGTIQSRAITDAAGNESARMITNPRMGIVKETGDPYRIQRWEAPDISLGGFADLLDQVAPLSLPVVDMTGLSGRYDLVLEVSLTDPAGVQRKNSEDPKPDLDDMTLDAFNRGLQKLGLQLERRKGPVERLVVDHVVSTPTGN